MTQIQVDYQKLQEQKRINDETIRHNSQMESQAIRDLDEAIRSHKVNEMIGAQNAQSNASQAYSSAARVNIEAQNAETKAGELELAKSKAPYETFRTGSQGFSSLISGLGSIASIVRLLA